jgi:hypothetical protein
MNNEGRCIIGNILKDITVMMILMIICSTNPTRTSSRYTAIISTYSPYQMMTSYLWIDAPMTDLELEESANCQRKHHELCT